MNIFIHFSAKQILLVLMWLKKDGDMQRILMLREGSNKLSLNTAKQIYCHAFRQLFQGRLATDVDNVILSVDSRRARVVAIEIN